MFFRGGIAQKEKKKGSISSLKLKMQHLNALLIVKNCPCLLLQPFPEHFCNCWIFKTKVFVLLSYFIWGWRNIYFFTTCSYKVNFLHRTVPESRETGFGGGENGDVWGSLNAALSFLCCSQVAEKAVLMEERCDHYGSAVINTKAYLSLLNSIL